MNQFLLILSLGFMLGACSKMDDKPANGNDTLLSKKMNVEPVPEMVTKDTASGLIVDQTRYRTPEHEALLQRFQPIEIARAYHAFKIIRKPGITQVQIDSFTKGNKISVDELKAILEEGDRLGWGKH